MKRLVLFSLFFASGCLLLSNSLNPPHCGDGIVQQPLGEECDDGNNTPNDGCGPNCQLEIPETCGDGVQDSGEECDDGNNNDGDGCDALCRLEFCGDGIVQQPLGEECDDGNNIRGDGCDPACQSEILENCGDGVLDRGEECDDGNRQIGDGCDSQCRFELCGGAICGDTNPCVSHTCLGGKCTPLPVSPGTLCDSGENPGLREICITGVCLLSVCGDTITDGINNGGTEECDQGNSNSDSIPNACRTNCQNPRCGDSVVDDDFNEVCDDGNTNPGDGCDQDCQPE